MKKILLFLFFMPTLCFSEPLATSPKVPQNLHIYSVSGSAYVVMEAKGCSGNTYYLPSNHVKFDALFSLLLAAQMSNKEVKLRFDGCNSNGQGIVVGAYLP